jgi:hypothetical protein
LHEDSINIVAKWCQLHSLVLGLGIVALT